MKKVLFVSYNHDRMNLADSIQNHRLIPSLKEYADVDILCRKYDNLCAGDDIIRIYSPDLYYLDIVLYKLFPFLRPVYSIDAALWVLISEIRLRTIKKKYDNIIVTFEPYSIHQLVPFLKRQTKAKVISALYDPLSNNCFFNRSKLGIKFQLKLEKKIAEFSEVRVTNSEKRKCFLHKIDGSEVVNIPFCAPTVEIERHNDFSDKIVIAHAGSLHGIRRMDEINQIVSIVKQKFPNLEKKLEISFYGRVVNKKRKCVFEAKNDDVIKFYPYVSQAELQIKLNNAHALLLLDPLIDEEYYCFPSKLCEYFQYRKPIFALCTKGSPADVVLKGSGNISSNHGDEELMADSIIKLIEDRQSFSSGLHDIADIFNPSNVASLFAKLFK